jgi:hypothetical protein
MPSCRTRTAAQASAKYARKKWRRQRRATAAAAATAATARALEPQLLPQPALSRYTLRRRNAQKPLSEVQERGHIEHDAGLPCKIYTTYRAANYTCLSYAADLERFWCCNGSSTVLLPLGDYLKLLKALLTETAPTRDSGVKQSPRSVAFYSKIY